MTKLKTQKPLRARTRKPVKAAKRKSLVEMNDWMSAHHESLLRKAERNCVKLTGRATFGQSSRRKSA